MNLYNILLFHITPDIFMQMPSFLISLKVYEMRGFNSYAFFAHCFWQAVVVVVEVAMHWVEAGIWQETEEEEDMVEVWA